MDLMPSVASKRNEKKKKKITNHAKAFVVGYRPVRPVTFLCHCQGRCGTVSPSLEIFFSRFSKIHSVD